MSSDLSNTMLDKLRKHFETGVPIERMTFTPDQKKRIQMCIEGYNRLATDPFMDIRTYMKNRFNRTYSELKNDIKLIDYIASFFEGGQKNISKLQVRNASRKLMKNGSETGNMKALHDGASLLIKLDRLDQPDAPEEMSEDMAKMPIMVTTDVSRKFSNKRGRSEEEMKRIRKKWGVSIDKWQGMMEDGAEIQDAEIVEDEVDDEKEESFTLDESEDVNNIATDDNATDDSALSEESESDEDEDDFDDEIEAIIASDMKAHEERVKKNK